MNLKVKNITKEYAGHQVLDNISLSLGDREFVGLVGENGSGKTTFLKMIAGLETPDTGLIQVEPKTSAVGYIPQVPDQSIGLSSGELARKYLADVMKKQPDLVLLDEPTNHLDFETLNWLESYLKNYKGTVIVVSHDRRFLDNLTHKIIELDRGRVKVYGGNYSFYRQQKEIERAALVREYEKQQQTIKRMEKDIVEKKERIQRL